MEGETLFAFIAFSVLLSLIVFAVAIGGSGGCFLSFLLLMAFGAVVHYAKSNN